MPELEKKSLSSRFSYVYGAAVLAAGVFVMITAGATNGVADNSADNALRAQGPLVEVLEAETVDGAYTIEAPGRLQSRQNLVIVGEVAGKISYVNPKFVLGGRFKEGETLFRINDADYKAELARAKAGVASAKAALVRAKLDNERRIDLVKKGAVSVAARDEAVANLASAEAGVEQAKADLIRAQDNVDRTDIKAPFPALVLSEAISKASYVSPGQELARIIDTRAAELVAGLSPRKAAAVTRALSTLAEGKLVAVAKPNDGSVGSGTLTGFVDQFSPSIDAASRSALVVAVFPDAFKKENAGRVFANDFMTLEIGVKSTEQVWQVPVGAIRKDKFVWIVEGGKLVKRNVTVIDSQGENAFVISNAGLNGSKIMLTLLSEEIEGMSVRSATAVLAQAQ